MPRLPSVLVAVAVCTVGAAVALSAHAEPAAAPQVLHPDALAPVTVSPGVVLKELSGRSAPPAARSEQVSVALFKLAPGRASAWSYTLVGEESFFVLRGHGDVVIGNRSQPVRPGSYVVVPPKLVRSIRASRGEPLEFYAITAPAWHADDDVLTTAPDGFTK